MADTPKSAAWRAVKHLRARPFLLAASELPVSLVTHGIWGDSPMAAVGLTVGAGVLTGMTWWAGQGTTSQRRIHATASTAAASAYLVVATATDPLNPSLLSTLAIGGAVGAGSWSIRQTLRINPDAKDSGTSSQTGVLTKSLGKAKAMLRGDPQVEPNKVTAGYRLAPGEMTNADVAARLVNMASELGVSPTAIRIVPDPDNASQGEIVIVPTDMLTIPTPWPGPVSVGGSITEPVPIGLYEDGAVEQIWLPYDQVTGRNATHFGVFGMNGSAKSSAMTIAVTDILTRSDVLVWACDPVKGQQTLGPLLPYLDWAETTMAGSERMVDVLPRVIAARADALGRAGFKNWTPEAFEKLGMPYLLWWAEETAKLFREGAELEPIAETARSAGVSIAVSLQRPSATTMPTDVREQLGGVMCFGVKGSTTADMALPDDVRDAGARPEVWENRKPGYNYLVAPGVDEQRYAMPARSYIPPTDDEVDTVLGPLPRVPADPVTADAAGDAYTQRHRYTGGASLPTAADPEEDTDAAIEEGVARDILDLTGDTGSSDDPEADPDTELPPPAGFLSLGQADPAIQEKSTEEAYAELLAMLQEYRDAGAAVIGPKDFAPFGKRERIGRARSWVSAQLNALADEGIHLAETEEPGVYRLLHPQLTPA